MPQDKLSMRKIRDVLRYRHSTGLSLEAIARALNISKGVVSKYLRLATDAGLSWPLPDDLDDAALEKRLYQLPTARAPTFTEPDYARIHQELKRKGVTLILLWEEYQQEVGDTAFQYTAFCTRYKAWAGKLKRTMRQTHRAGEKLFADYAGPTMPIIDADTGEIRPASIFVAVLGASSYTFACATAGQTQADWLSGLDRALRFIGGVPELRITRSMIEVLAKGRRVASHPRNPRKGGYSTIADHMPAAHRAHAEWPPGRLMNWAASVGPATGELVERLLMEKQHPEQGYRSCLGLMRLARTVGRERMEAACTRALAIGAHRYRSVASILEKGLDRQPLTGPAQAELALPDHANVRGPDYYH